MGRQESNIEMSAPTNTNELFCSYAALLLADADQEVPEDSLNAVISAAGGAVPASYAAIFAKVAGMKPVNDLVEAASKVGGGGDAGAAAAAPVEEKKKSSSSSSDGGGGAGMFDE